LETSKNLKKNGDFFFLILQLFFSKHQMSAKVRGKELEQAAWDGKTDEILRLWRENGDTLDVAYIGCFGGTPLHFAARNGQGEACRVLVSTCRVNIDSLDSYGWTPLIVAANYNELQIVEVLLELGADIALRDADDKTALDRAREGGHAEVAALLESAEWIPEIKSANKI
jgi:ankyrin repeat protein